MDNTALDNDLLARIGQQKDRQAFDTLCDRYAKPIFAMARRMGLEVCDAEDAAQDLLVKIWQKANLWDPAKGASAKTWIYHMAYNLVIDKHRKNKSFFGLVSQKPLPEEPADHSHDKESLARKDLVAKGLKDIPERQRQALVLFYYEGMTTKEIADAHDSTPKAVERLLARARTSFRDNIKRLEEQHASR